MNCERRAWISYFVNFVITWKLLSLNILFIEKSYIYIYIYRCMFSNCFKHKTNNVGVSVLEIW